MLYEPDGPEYEVTIALKITDYVFDAADEEEAKAEAKSEVWRLFKKLQCAHGDYVSYEIGEVTATLSIDAP